MGLDRVQPGADVFPAVIHAGYRGLAALAVACLLIATGTNAVAQQGGSAEMVENEISPFLNAADADRPEQPSGGDTPSEKSDRANESLEQRLDRLEKENDELRERLDAWGDPGKKKDEKPADPKSMKASWKNGVEFESADKQFKFHVGGRTQIDFALYHADEDMQFGPGGTGPIRDGINFRRGRLRADGTMYDQIDWVVEYDFVNSAGTTDAVPAPTDGYFTFKKLPVVGNFRIGLQKDPIGFDHLISSRYLSFMERSFNQDAFYGGFNNGFVPGVMFFDNWGEERGTWWVGAFKTTTNAFQWNTGGGEYAVVSRVTALPIYECDGEYLLHVGGSYRHVGMDDGQLRHRTRGPVRSGLSSTWPLYGNTGNIQGEGEHQVNLELAGVWGALNIQGDYLVSVLSDGFRTRPSGGDLFYHGGYIEALYFLTGEHRAYNLKNAVFERVTPNRNFRYMNDEECEKDGWGAWQVGIRYNYLDLDSDGIDGGRLNDITLGLNWFLNPNLKLQWNYSVTQRKSPTRLSDGTSQSIGMRLAHDF